jgi:hypothetical protein
MQHIAEEDSGIGHCIIKMGETSHCLSLQWIPQPVLHPPAPLSAPPNRRDVTPHPHPNPANGVVPRGRARVGLQMASKLGGRARSERGGVSSRNAVRARSGRSRLRQPDEVQCGRTELEGGQPRSDGAQGRGQQPTTKLKGAGSGGGESQGRGLEGTMRELARTSSRNSSCKTHGLPLFGDGGAGAARLSLTL